MDVFKDQWEKQVRVLTEAVDDITSVDDFLSVSGNHRRAPYKAAEGGEQEEMSILQMSWVHISSALLGPLSFQSSLQM